MNLPKFYLSRYLRYAPSMMVLVLFIISSFPMLLIDGPVIRYYHDIAWKCQNYWWSALLMIQNYANIKNTVSGNTFICLLIMFFNKFVSSVLIILGISTRIFNCIQCLHYLFMLLGNLDLKVFGYLDRYQLLIRYLFYL